MVADLPRRGPTLFSRDKVRDLRGLQQQALHPLLQEAIGPSDTLMLTQMLEPRCDEERFHEAARFGSIFEDAPAGAKAEGIVYQNPAIAVCSPT